MRPMTRQPHIARAASLACVLALASCGSKPAPAVNSGLDSLASGTTAAAPRPSIVNPDEVRTSDLPSLLEQQALDMQRLLDGLPPGEPRQAAFNPPPSQPVRPGTERVIEGPLTVKVVVDPIPESPSDPATIESPQPKTLTEKIDDASLLLVDLLRQHTADGGSAMRTLTTLAAMEAVRPGAMQQLLTPASADASPLDSAQRAIVEVFRDLVLATVDIAGREWKGDEAGAYADRVSEFAARLQASRPLRILNAELCTSVRGFGQFSPFPENTFVAGRGQRAIVYVEVDRFAYRALGGDERSAEAVARGDRWAVELTQEMSLWNETATLRAMFRREERVLDTSRNKRRDFHLITDILIPSTLSVGIYNLKITVRDKVSGAEAEATIPIRIIPAGTLATEGSLRD